MSAFTRLYCQDYQKCLPPSWNPDNKATGLRPANSAVVLHAYSHCYMDVARLQWQVLKLHVCAPCCAALPCCSGRFSNCIQALCSHCNAVAGYQTECTNARCCHAAVAEYQTACARGCPAAVAGSQIV
jgi:hypothetical protein